jgi:hypothetical protein
LTDLLLETADRLNAHQLEIFDEILTLLIKRVDVQALARVGEAIAGLNSANLELARAAIQTAIESAEIGIRTKVAERVDYTDATAKALELNKQGKLNDSTVNRFAVWHEHHNLVAALSLLATVPIETIEPLLQEGNYSGLVVACRACRLNWNTTLAVIGSTPDGSRLSAQEVEQLCNAFEGLHLSIAQWLIRFGSAADFALKLRPASGASTKAGAA